MRGKTRLPLTRLLSTVAYSKPFPGRTHDCGALRADDHGTNVTLTGWLTSARKASKSLSFFSIKDSFGTTQLVVKQSPESQGRNLIEELLNVPLESTIVVHGEVKARPSEAKRQGPSTGAIEVVVNDFTLLNPASKELPFYPSNTNNLANEDLRARYRYLDLRRDTLSQNLHKRAKVSGLIRTGLESSGFIEVETPLLLRSSPEGAREFLVPARGSSSSSPVPSPPTSASSPPPDPAAFIRSLAASSPSHSPVFYALSQSPQQPKQLLIASGAIDRYFQFARCFRDEDGRKDRQPEFTQVDLEMAWVGWGDAGEAINDGWRIGGREVKNVVEDVIRKVWRECENEELDETFRVMTYQEAMGRYGSDKPDTRFGLEITPLTQHMDPPVQAFLSSQGLHAEFLAVRSSDGFASPSDWAVSEFEDVSTITQITITPENINTWWLNPNLVRGLALDSILGTTVPLHKRKTSPVEVAPGDVIFVALRKERLEGGSTSLGRLRLRLSEEAQKKGTLTLPTRPHFLWITEFPLFTHADDDKDFLAQGRWSSSHHPFTAPRWEDVDVLMKGERIEEIRGQHYDLVLNGMEIGGGSVRIHDPVMQEHVLRQILELSDAECSSFAHLLHALQCGAPPHGGIALGFDRLMSILCNTKSIRDVIAFPKTAGGTDPVFKSPSVVGDDVLREYRLRKL